MVSQIAEEWIHELEKLRDPSHGRFLSPGAWKELCERQQLRVVRCETTPFKQPDLELVFRYRGNIRRKSGKSSRAYSRRAGVRAKSVSHREGGRQDDLVVDTTESAGSESERGKLVSVQDDLTRTRRFDDHARRRRRPIAAPGDSQFLRGGLPWLKFVDSRLRSGHELRQSFRHTHQGGATTQFGQPGRGNSTQPLVVITGLSGSGKSSLAFDTLYAEGQRKYVESLSAYARQFLDQMQKPEVDYIEGLSPAIAIEQRTSAANPRSTIATTTEIYDYLRLLFAAVGRPHDPVTGEPVVRQTPQQIADAISRSPEGTKTHAARRRSSPTSPENFAM